MPDAACYMVLLYDTREDTYTMLDHNLALKQASSQVESLRKDRLPAYYQRQRRRHRPPEAINCGTCDRDLDVMVFRPPNPDYRRQ